MLVPQLSTNIPSKSEGDLRADGSVPLTADWDVGANEVRMETLYLDVADGTAPMTVVSTTVVANLNADQVDGLDSTDLVLVDGSQALTANWDAGSFQIRAETFQSDVTTGTAPLTVASTTLVSNLNADLLDGNEATVFALADGTRWTTTNTANRLPISDGSGNLVVSSVTDTEAGYLSGVTSSIQTQLDGKAASSHNHAASDINSGTLAHERGGIEADISSVAKGDVLAGTATGTIGIIAASGASDGDVLTLQADGSLAYETPAAGSSLPVDDTTSVVRDPVDNTKLVRIDAGAITTATTRVITMGDRDVDLANGGTFAEASHNHAASEITSGTLAHERGGIEADISAVAIGDIVAGTGTGTMALVTSTGHVRHSTLTIQSSGAADWEAPTAYEETDGATVTFNIGNGLDQYVVLDGNRTLALNTAAINAMPNGTKFTIKLTQDGTTGSRTVTWFSGISWAGGSAPTLTTTAGKSDRFIFVKTGTGAYEGYVVGQNI